MLLPLSSTSSRAVIALGAAAAALALGYFSVRNARATHAAGLDTFAGYDRAARLEPANARNWYLLGRYWQYNIEDPDPQRAITDYQQSLSLNPRYADAWLDLAAAYDGEGNSAAARDAFLSAKKAYPASADVAWRYGNFLLRQGQLPAAFSEIHHAVLQDSKRGAEAFSRCWRVKPDAEAILDQVIPPSKDVYVAILHDLGNARSLDPALSVWKRLVDLHPKMSPQEVGTFTNALLQSGRIPEVLSVWQQAVSMMENPPPPDPPGSVIWDGGFESGVVGDGLAWQFPRERFGVRADLDRSQKHSGDQSLRLVFSGKENVNYAEACHYAVVQPRIIYHLSAWVQTKALTTSEGVRLRLMSFEKSGPKSVETPGVHGTEPWTKLSLFWTSAPDSKLVQVCISRHASEEFEGNIQGTAWIDDFSLAPVSSETVKP